MQKGARTFLVKVKAHRGEPLNELADTQAENEGNCKMNVDSGQCVPRA